jgi:hypothetical protein
MSCLWCRLVWAVTKNPIYGVGSLSGPARKIDSQKIKKWPSPDLGPWGLDHNPTICCHHHHHWAADAKPRSTPAIAVVGPPPPRAPPATTMRHATHVQEKGKEKRRKRERGRQLTGKEKGTCVTHHCRGGRARVSRKEPSLPPHCRRGKGWGHRAQGCAVGEMRRRRSKPGVSALAVGELKRHLVE